MKNCLRVLLLGTVLTLIGRGNAQSAPGPGQDVQRVQPTNPSFSIHISAAQDTVKVGLGLRIKIAMTNTTKRALRFGPYVGDPYPIYFIEDVRDHDGKPVPLETKLCHGLGLGKEQSWSHTMVSGYTQESELDIARSYDVGRPGQYSIQLQKYMPGTHGKVVKSNTIIVTVLP